MENQQYCISARNRNTGFTESITGPMSKSDSENWKPNSRDKKYHVYFRVSKHPFKTHKK